ncbi:hypothetical protein GCM10009858_42230 [Terrabacter carboxydivorans]|uniref:Uncharacterized protein n=1 Tax=Terrabacter carboxydivorans TaxID=619730 RepID=A0ABP5ZRD6_9MICO
MDRTQSFAGKALRVALIVLGAGVVGYVALMVLLFYGLREPYPYLHVTNETGRPLLIERADTPSSPGEAGWSSLVWGTKGYWQASSSDQCDRDQLVARDLLGTVVARREGACSSEPGPSPQTDCPQRPDTSARLFRPTRSRSASSSTPTGRRSPRSGGGGSCLRTSPGPRPWVRRRE